MSFWNKISNLGIRENLNFFLHKEKKITNRFFFIVCCIQLIYIPVIIIFKLDRLYTPFLLMLFSLVYVFTILKKEKHELGAFLIVLFETIFLCYASTLGYKGFFYFYLIPLFILAMIVISNKWLNISITTFLICGFLIGSYFQDYFYNPSVSSPTLSKVFFILNNTIIILISVYAIFHYKIINKEYEHNLNAQKNKIEKQHKALNSVHTDLQDSINYAQRIQDAILPSEIKIHKYFKNNFVIYSPKEVISGDFYWLQKINNSILFAVADCTGHGVSGAMLSVICNNALNRSVKEFKLESTSLILTKANELISNVLNKSNRDDVDRMDISMIKLPVDHFEKENFELEFTGINQSLFFVSNETLKTYKANRVRIGNFQSKQLYHSHKISINKGDNIYLTSDGYYSQIGGKDKKKLKNINFKHLIEELSSLDMSQQKIKLNTFFNKWSDNEPQIDDICIVGIKF